MKAGSAISTLRPTHMIRKPRQLKHDSIPLARGAVPLLGHALRLGRDPIRFLASLPADADLIRIRLGPNPVVLICSPELIHQMLRDDRTFDKGGPLVDLVKPLVGDGLATCPRSRHRQSRRLIQPIFRTSRFLQYAQTMTAAITAVTDGWRDGQILDVPVEMRRLAVHAAVKTLFSDALAPSAVDQIAEDFTTILVGFAQRMQKPPVLGQLPTPGNREYRHALRRVRQTISDTIANRRSEGTDHDDLLDTLLTTESDGSPVLDDTVLLDNAATFLIAPTATIASVMAWVLHLLAKHPEIQHRLHDEVDTVLAGGTVGFDHLPQLELTRRIVSETIRMYPSLWFAPLRIVTTDTYLGGHHLPAGTVLAYSAYLAQHRSDLYDAPERFDPDRWDPSHQPAPPRGGVFAFGGGARHCIASEYASNEMVLALATIASRWRMEPVPGRPLRPQASVNLTARGLRLRAVLRTPQAKQQHLTYVGQASQAVRPGAGTRRPTQRKAWLI